MAFEELGDLHLCKKIDGIICIKFHEKNEIKCSELLKMLIVCYRGVNSELKQESVDFVEENANDEPFSGITASHQQIKTPYGI